MPKDATCASIRLKSTLNFGWVLLFAFMPAGALTPQVVEESTSGVEIHLETSRVQPTVGSGVGYQAELINRSSTPIWLVEKSVVLVLPPEMQAATNSNVIAGFFPTLHNLHNLHKDLPEPSWPYATLVLQPHSRYRVNWTYDPVALHEYRRSQLHRTERGPAEPEGASAESDAKTAAADSSSASSAAGTVKVSNPESASSGASASNPAKASKASNASDTSNASQVNAPPSYYDEPGVIHGVLRDMAAELSFIFFSPGDYKVAVIAHYWDKDPWVKKLNPQGAVRWYTEAGYHTSAETAVIRAAAPQSVLLLGSAVGGLIAFFILPQVSAHRPARKATLANLMPLAIQPWFVLGQRCLHSIASACGAILLSAIVSILLARISDSQFLLRVTVADFWSAVAVGFIANYFGVKLIGRILHVPNAEAGGEAHAAPAAAIAAPAPAPAKRAE